MEELISRVEADASEFEWAGVEKMGVTNLATALQPSPKDLR